MGKRLLIRQRRKGLKRVNRQHFKQLKVRRATASSWEKKSKTEYGRLLETMEHVVKVVKDINRKVKDIKERIRDKETIIKGLKV